MTASSKLTLTSHSAEETKKIGAWLGSCLKKGDVVLFLANLGAGKTTLVQGLVKVFGIHEGVFSPTFILAQTFPGKIPVHHLDFYRLTPKEILDMGATDYLGGLGEIGQGVVLIEWAERCRQLWPQDRIEVHMKIKPRSADRMITMKAQGPRSRKVLGDLKKKYL